MKRLIRGRVNIGQPSYTPLAYVNQLDDITLELDIYNGNSPLDVTGQKVSLYAKRSNKTVVEQLEGFSIATSKVTGDVKNSCFAVPGITEMQLEFTDSNGKTTVSSFYIHVNKSLSSEDSITASNEIGILTEAKEKEPIRQENEKGRVEAEKLRVQAETNRAAAEKIREQQELARQTCYKELEESREDFDGGIHKNIKLRLMRDFGDIYERFNEANLLPYEKEFIMANNSYKGMTKDLVLKGKTYQNPVNSRIPSYETAASAAAKYTFEKANNYAKLIIKEPYTTNEYSVIHWGRANNLLLKPNTKYTVYCETNGGRVTISNVNGLGVCSNKSNFVNNRAIITTNDLSALNSETIIYIEAPTTVGTYEWRNLMMFEGDYTNKPIPPYFEGIRSVNEDAENMEIVSTGKNLLDKTYIQRKMISNSSIGAKLKLTDSQARATITKPLILQTGKNYTIKTQSLHNLIIGVDNDETIQETFTWANDRTITSKYGLRYYITFRKIDNTDIADAEYQNILNSELQLEEGTTATAYEPYQEQRIPIKMKTLRGLPNGVCDTSDGIRKVGKFVLNGNGNWVNSGDGSFDTETHMAFSKGIPDAADNGFSLICDKFKIGTIYNNDSIEVIGLNSTATQVGIKVLKSRLSTPDIQGFKQWINSNNVTLYYKLATSIKEEGNTEQLRTYDNQTNIFTDNSLVEPIISCKVPSNVQAVVSTLRLENESLNNEINTLQDTEEENNLTNIETSLEQDARLTALELGL